MQPPVDLYKFHCANLRRVAIGMDRVARALRQAIVGSDQPTIDSLVRLYAMLVGTWAECQLKKLLYEPGGFDGDTRKNLRDIPRHFDRWIACVEVAFRQRYKVPKADLNAANLGFTQYARFTGLNELLQTELRPIIELRNKFAHGQWAYLLTSEEEDVSSTLMGSFKRENLQSLQFKRNLLEQIAKLVSDLITTAESFDRDFDKYYRSIEGARNNLKNREYSSYVMRLRERHIRGKSKREGTFPLTLLSSGRGTPSQRLFWSPRR